MIVIGEKLNSSIPSVYAAIEKKDSRFVSDLAVKQEEAGSSFFRYQCWNVCGSRRGEPALADEHGTGGFQASFGH